MCEECRDKLDLFAIQSDSSRVAARWECPRCGSHEFRGAPRADWEVVLFPASLLVVALGTMVALVLSVVFKS